MRLLGRRDFRQLLSAFQSRPFTNVEASQLLKLKRQSSWERLARLTQAGLLERSGHTYRVTPFAREFVSALSTTMRGVVTGAEPRRDPEMLRSLLVAQQGVELLYDRGRISKEEYAVHRAKLEEMKNELG